MKSLEDDKIHLLHLVQTLGVGGAEVLLLHYIKALGTKRYRHHVYCFGDDGPIRKKIEKLNVQLRMGPKLSSIKNPIKFVIRFLILMKDLLKFIKTHGVQIIQAHLGHANQLGVLVGKLSGVPAFPTVHNTMAFVDRRDPRDVRVHLIRAVDTIMYKIADRIIAVSQEIKLIIQRRFVLKDCKIIVLKNGIIFQESSTRPANLALEFQAKQDTLKIIAVGSLTYQKAFEILVRAVAELTKEGFDNLLVLIAGDGLERMRLEQEIQELDVGKYVKLLGIRDDVISLLESSDLFVIPSRYEGLSIAMIEAMACGLPIIASSAPGLKNYINHGQNGILFPVEDYEALAERIMQLAKDEKLRKKLSCGAKESFRREYDMRNNIRPLDILFQKYAVMR